MRNSGKPRDHGVSVSCMSNHHHRLSGCIPAFLPRYNAALLEYSEIIICNRVNAAHLSENHNTLGTRHSSPISTERQGSSTVIDRIEYGGAWATKVPYVPT